MAVLHGTMTGAEVDALRLSLKKKLSAVSDLPLHTVAFRVVLAWLTTAGQAPLELDGFGLFLTILLSLSRFPSVDIVVYCGERGNCTTDV